MDTTLIDEPNSGASLTDYPSAERVANFVRRVIRGEKFYGGPERRVSLRYPITMPIKVTPLNDDGEPVAEPFLAVTRDISVGGLCFYHTQPVKQHRVQVEMTSPTRERLTVRVEVMRHRQAGPFYEVGGEFRPQE